MESSALTKLTLTVLTGAVAGFANVTAGGRSLLTLPVLNIIGLDLGVANATNRLSILFDMINRSSAFMLATGAVLGGNVGARFNLRAKNRTIRLILACAVFVSSIKMLWESLR